MNLTRLLIRFIPISKERLLKSGFDKIHEEVYVMADLVIECRNKRFYIDNKRVKNMLQVANYVYGRE
jgi:hypothetical protein